MRRPFLVWAACAAASMLPEQSPRNKSRHKITCSIDNNPARVKISFTIEV
jgi:hypothetical protein